MFDKDIIHFDNEHHPHMIPSVLYNQIHDAYKLPVTKKLFTMWCMIGMFW